MLDNWTKAALISGTITITSFAAYPTTKTLVQDFVPKVTNTIISTVQDYVPFIKPELKLDEKDISALVENLEKNPEAVLNSLQSKWFSRYTNPRDLGDNLEAAKKRSRPNLPDIKSIFKQHGVPDHLVYLAITESHWNPNALSQRKAVGLYQFIKKTAISSGCMINSRLGYDERKNEFLAADCAARHLLYLHKKFDGDWNLALAAYNSGMPWEYIKEARKNKKTINYIGYLRFLGQKLGDTQSKYRLSFINENLNYPPHFNAIAEILKKYHTPYFKIGPKTNLKIEKSPYSNLNLVSQRYGISLDELQNLNPHISNTGKIPPGGRLVLPNFIPITR
jgi:soluble lytic murein transglycosylase-like protein